MSSLSLPPRFVSAPVQEVYSRRLSDEYFRTLAQIRGLAYKTQGERTPALTLDDLVALRGLDRSNVYRHLAFLREHGYIRSERVGKYQFVIYPLRWEPGAALPTDGDEFTDEERKALFGEGDEKSRASATNFKKSRKGAIQHDHVVVLNHESHENQQQHDESQICDSNFDGLLAGLVAVFVGNGMDPLSAENLSCELFTMENAAAVIARQLAVFERRCAQARASKRGLENPIGLLCASIRGDWPLPAEAEAKAERRWYTDEEFEQIFEH